MSGHERHVFGPVDGCAECVESSRDLLAAVARNPSVEDIAAMVDELRLLGYRVIPPSEAEL